MNKVIKTTFKTEVSRFGFFILISVFILGCEQEQQLSAQLIVERSIATHGGLEKWNTIKTLRFDKTTILYNKDGSIESSTMQQQSFQLQPELKGEIVSFYKGILGLYYNDEKFTKRVKDSMYIVSDPEELEKSKNSFFAAHYVVCQPFKLLDSGTALNFIGVETMNDTQVYVIDVGYEGDTEVSDKWTYYFDVDTYKLVANKVKHNTTVSVIKNLKFNETNGLTFNAHRKSYTLKNSGEIDFLRAEYFYENFKVTNQ